MLAEDTEQGTAEEAVHLRCLLQQYEAEVQHLRGALIQAGAPVTMGGHGAGHGGATSVGEDTMTLQHTVQEQGVSGQGVSSPTWGVATTMSPVGVVFSVEKQGGLVSPGSTLGDCTWVYMCLCVIAMALFMLKLLCTCVSGERMHTPYTHTCMYTHTLYTAPRKRAKTVHQDLLSLAKHHHDTAAAAADGDGDASERGCSPQQASPVERAVGKPCVDACVQTDAVHHVSDASEGNDGHVQDENSQENAQGVTHGSARAAAVQGDDGEYNDRPGEDNDGEDNDGEDNEGEDNDGEDNEGEDNDGEDNDGEDNEGEDNDGEDNNDIDNGKEQGEDAVHAGALTRALTRVSHLRQHNTQLCDRIQVCIVCIV